MTRTLLLMIGCSAACSPCSSQQSQSPPTDATTLFEHDGQFRGGGRSETRTQRFDVDVKAGDRLVVTVSSRAFDPSLQVTLPGADAPLTNEDWEGSSEHAQLAFVVPEDGAMKIGVAGNADAEGRFRLLVRRPEDSAAGGVQVVRVGEEHRGRLSQSSPQTPDRRWFEPLWIQVAEPPAAMVVSGDDGFVPEVMVTDPAGRVSDGGAGGSFALATSGLYAVQVVAPQPGTEGSYKVDVHPGAAPSAESLRRAHHQAPPLEHAASALPINQAFDGALDESDPRLGSGEIADVFRLELTEIAPVELELTSSEFDPYLMVVSPDGQLWENDDAGAGTGAMLRMDALEPGVYRVVATSYRAGEQGRYEMKAHVGAHELRAGGETPSGSNESIRGTLARGDRRLDSGEFFDEHSLSLPEGAHVAIEARSSDFDAYVIVIPPNGERLENDDGEGLGTNARVAFTSLGGSHRVLVTSYSAGEVGGYELRRVTQGAHRESGAAGSERPTLGPEAQGSLTEGDARLSSGEFADHFSLPLTAGASVQLRLTSSAFDPYLIVRTPSGEQHDNDDLVPGNTNAGLDIPVAEAGEYTVIATSYRPGETGAYRLRRLSGPEVPRPTASGDSERGGHVYGLFAGISDYPAGRSDLPECANDARKLAEALRSAGLLTEERQTILTDSQATQANLRHSLLDYAARLGPDDVFVFFYSGHGGQQPVESDPREIDDTNEYLALYDGALLDDDLGQLFDGMRARVSVIAIDACHAGGFSKDLITRPGRIGLFSSEEDVLSAVANQFQAGGYLSHFLREGVSGGADAGPADRVLTVGELTHYVYRQFGAHAQDIHMAATYQHLVVDRGAVGVDQVLWSYR